MRKSSGFLFCGKEHFLYIKGIAILAIMLSHIGNFSGKTWFTPLGGIGVAIFLACSGYGLTKSYEKNGLQRYWRKKLTGVYLPFLFVELLFSIVLQRPFWDVILDITLIDIAYPYGWYMWYLFLCYAFFWLAFRFLPGERSRLCALGGLSLLSFFLFRSLQGEQALSFFIGVLWGTYDARVLRSGVGAESHSPEGRMPRKTRMLLVGGALLLVFVVLLAVKQIPAVRAQHSYLLTLLNLVMKLSCAVGILFVTWVVHPLTKPLFFVGTISYPLYLTHGYFMFAVTERLLGGYITSSLLMLVMSFIAAVLLHYVICGIEMLVKRMRAA